MNNNYTVIAFYKFIPLTNINDLQISLLKYCKEHSIKGTILLALEGINSTLAGSPEEIEKFCSFIRSLPEFTDMTFKYSTSLLPPFKRTKVIIKKEIVTFKVDDLDLSQVGEYLSAEAWDNMIQKDETIVIDTRNDYEIVFGTFHRAIDPKTKNFSDFPAWAEKELADCNKDTPIAMFCTGGVRCEKSTAYLKQRGFKNVYHLKGGILQYLEDTKNKNHMWKGSCFVFDDRLSVDSQLKSIEEMPCS